MVKVFRFIKFAWGLLKYNIGTLLVFEILYKFSMAAIFRPVLLAAFRLSLKVRGLYYLSDENIGVYLKGPGVWIILFLLLLCLAFFTLLDICCIITCLHASYRKQKIPLLALLRKGTLSALNIFKQKNWLMILYLLIIIPVTHFALISGYISSFELPEFIFEYIQSHTLLFIVYIAFWVYIGYRSFHWIYSIHYFCLEKASFKEGRRNSWILIKGHFWKDILVLFVWNGIILGVYYGIIMGGAYLISAINRAMASSDLFSSLTLSGVSILLGVMGMLYFCFCLSSVYLCISMLFYYRKATSGEPITGPYDDLQNAYRLQETKWAKKLYQYRKRIIAIAVVAALGINFIYSFGEKKGVIDLGLQSDIKITAHRGYSEMYPENTIPAFKGAVEIGADCIELDVQQTKDGEIIVMHDSNLKRTTGVDKNIWETTYDEMKYLDAGSWFDKKYKETVIPTLDEVLTYTKGKIRLNIELKPTGYETDFEQSVVDIVEKHHCQKEVVLSSMKYECLEKIKEINPKIQTVYITSVSLGNFTVLDAADGYSVEAMMLTQKFVNQAHRAGKEVLVWTVNSEDSMERVLEMGVDGIITDKPAAAQKLIYQKKHSGLWDQYIEKLLGLQ
ncbi:Glycerophosphoryl diester phosphodiesterase [uncultured Roseburia sp.]|uniref:Glycerophosphodiester phosphodiesterase n=1 Tax=Brotonthovivens ammoniilytica TaxID=2981725 RepID=A0ABT2TL84_9FIRM|nr:glycerophosphodiester phosphodiesterase [Brotonthovivens ammoniilytica]MCU6762960.1 glycerophosphodiester phosphodiesterase [Brotonthovivens ammoniilytica]SCI94943.1 Glycerophosphoryl diester phosphodiesterase [uncultured Roseburia sp.]